MHGGDATAAIEQCGSRRADAPSRACREPLYANDVATGRSYPWIHLGPRGISPVPTSGREAGSCPVGVLVRSIASLRPATLHWGADPHEGWDTAMSWRNNDLALEALAVQGYYDEDTRTLSQDLLAKSICEVFLRTPIRSSTNDVLDKKSALFQAGLTRIQVLDRVLPNFRARHELSDEERALLKKDPKAHPDLEERDTAINDLASLLWGTLGKTSRAGAVQALAVQNGLLLIEAKASRDGAPTTVKAVTDDQDLIIEFYVRPRGDQLVKVSGGVRDDCTMVGMAFEGINDRMKRELGVSVTTAVGRLMQVATPDLAALSAGPAKASKALTNQPRT